MRLFCTVSVGAAAVALMSAGPAGACLPIDIGLNGPLAPGGPTPAAGPGDAVGFTVSGTEPGAEYVVRIGGQVVASGRDEDGGGLASSFTMPNLGAAQTVYVEAIITHQGESWPLSAPLEFRPPRGSSGGPPLTSEPPSPGGAKPASHKTAEPAGASHSAATTTSQSTAKASRPATKPAVARPSHAVRPEPRWSRSLVDAHPVESASAVYVEAAPITTRGTPAPSEIPWYPLVLAALGLLVVGGGAAGLVRARRRRSDEPDDLIEAELQEIIAEERAKQTLMRAP